MIKILIVDDNVPALTMAVIRALGLVNDFEIHVLSLIENSFPPFRFSRHVQSYKSVEVAGDEDTVLKIKERALQIGADILFPIKEKTIRIVAERADEFAVFIKLPPMPHPEVLEKVRNKLLLDHLLFKNGMIDAEPLLFTHLLESELITRQIKYPFLIKPLWGSGGRGICRFNSAKQLSDYRNPSGFVSEDFMVQHYYEGQDIDISFLAKDGVILSYTIQQGLANANRLKYSNTIEFVYNNQLLEITTRFIGSIGFSGIAHLDFRFNKADGTYRLIDFNARYWSTLLGSVAAGINFPELACRIAMGNKIEQTNFKPLKYRSTQNLIEALFVSFTGTSTDLKILLSDPIPSFISFFTALLYYTKRFFAKFNVVKQSKRKAKLISLFCN